MKKNYVLILFLLTTIAFATVSDYELTDSEETETLTASDLLRETSSDESMEAEIDQTNESDELTKLKNAWLQDIPKWRSERAGNAHTATSANKHRYICELNCIEDKDMKSFFSDQTTLTYKDLLNKFIDAIREDNDTILNDEEYKTYQILPIGVRKIADPFIKKEKNIKKCCIIL